MKSPCKREDGNSFDPFAVAVCNGDIVIGHIPRKIHPFVRYIFDKVARSIAM